MPHVPDTVPGKRVTDAGARTDGCKALPSLSEVGAGCGKAARPVLCGGTGVTRFPTAIVIPAALAAHETTRYRISAFILTAVRFRPNRPLPALSGGRAIADLPRAHCMVEVARAFSAN